MPASRHWPSPAVSSQTRPSVATPTSVCAPRWNTVWMPYSAKLRFQNEDGKAGTNPEELIAAAHAGQTLVVVTHGGVLDMVYRTARGLGLNGPRQSEIPNAGLNRVRMAPAGRVEILDWADTRHLADLPAQPTYDQKKVSAADAA